MPLRLQLELKPADHESLEMASAGSRQDPVVKYRDSFSGGCRTYVKNDALDTDPVGSRQDPVAK